VEIWCGGLRKYTIMLFFFVNDFKKRVLVNSMFII
jgi:hypothetical protein